MIFLLFAVALASADPLRQALQSKDGLAKLFTQYETVEGKVYSADEAKLRFRLFRKSVKNAADTNELDLGWTAGLNLFSDLTEEEKGQYFGLNISLTHAQGEPLPLSDAPATEEIDWRKKGGVTGVKQQGRCGSCWTFGAVGSIEGVHFDKTGILKTFAEQELLDCVYEGKRDGCQGGLMHDAFNYMKQTQRLAPSTAVSYTAKDGSCNYESKPNGLKRTVEGMFEIPKSESSHVSALSRGPIAVAFEVTNDCQQYRGGVFKDTSCTGQPNHAVTMVGYNSEAFAIKNSWGGSWGDSGYIHMSRNHDNCGLYSHSVVISLAGSGPDPIPDPTDEPIPTPSDGPIPTPSDEPIPTPSDGPDPDPSCKDLAANCVHFVDWLCEYQPHNCRKTCGLC